METNIKRPLDESEIKTIIYKLFHMQSNARRIKNVMEMIPLQDGTKLEDPMKIVLVANHHRGSLFSKSPIEDEIASTDILSNIPKVISKPENSVILSTTLPS